ncbi:glycosyltransferase, partial [Citrobacter sp. AAK_AS5]
VLDQSDGDTLQEYIRQLGDERVVYHRVPGGAMTLGALRNQSVAQACGEYLALWDDDDLSAPHRLELQLSALLTLQAGACLLQ